MVTINQTNHYSGFAQEQFLFIQKQFKTMGNALEQLNQKVTELNEKVDALQAAIDADQESDAALVLQLRNEIATLEAQIANGATPEQLAAVKATLEGIASKLDTAKADVDENAGVTEAPAQ